MSVGSLQRSYISLNLKFLSPQSHLQNFITTQVCLFWNDGLPLAFSTLSPWAPSSIPPETHHRSNISIIIITSLSSVSKIHLKPIIGPAAKLHHAGLFVKREIFDVHLTRGMVDRRRLPLRLIHDTLFFKHIDIMKKNIIF